jgi:hypothetical protein
MWDVGRPKQLLRRDEALGARSVEVRLGKAPTEHKMSVEAPARLAQCYVDWSEHAALSPRAR